MIFVLVVVFIIEVIIVFEFVVVFLEIVIVEVFIIVLVIFEVVVGFFLFVVVLPRSLISRSNKATARNSSQTHRGISNTSINCRLVALSRRRTWVSRRVSQSALSATRAHRSDSFTHLLTAPRAAIAILLRLVKHTAYAASIPSVKSTRNLKFLFQNQRLYRRPSVPSAIQRPREAGPHYIDRILPEIALSSHNGAVVLILSNGPRYAEVPVHQ